MQRLGKVIGSPDLADFSVICDIQPIWVIFEHSVCRFPEFADTRPSNRLRPMSNLSRNDLANLARLARIEMTDQELDHLATEMDVILTAVARVQEVATADIKPTSHPLPLRNVTRADVVVPSLTPEAALSGAPAREDDRFRVPQILGEE